MVLLLVAPVLAGCFGDGSELTAGSGADTAGHVPTLPDGLDLEGAELVARNATHARFSWTATAPYLSNPDRLQGNGPWEGPRPVDRAETTLTLPAGVGYRLNVTVDWDTQENVDLTILNGTGFRLCYRSVYQEKPRDCELPWIMPTDAEHTWTLAVAADIPADGATGGDGVLVEAVVQIQARHAPGHDAPSPLEAAEAGPAGWRLDCPLGEHAGGGWPQTCLVRASFSPGSKTETWLQVNPADPDNVVVGVKDTNPQWSDACVWNGVFTTHDAGRTWQEVHIGGTYEDRQPGEPTWGYACNTDPMFAFASDGTLHYGLELYDVGPSINEASLGQLGAGEAVGWKVLLATSDDGGLSWSQIITFDGDRGTRLDYSRMAVNPATDTLIEAINAWDAGPMRIKTCHVLASRDGGDSAEKPVIVTPGPRTDTSCRALAISPEGTITLLFVDDVLSKFTPTQLVAPDERTVYAVRSHDDARSFPEVNEAFTYRPSPPAFEEGEHRAILDVEAAYDHSEGPDRGALYAVQQTWNGEDADVTFRRSDDDGRTWTEPVVIGSDASHHQYLPNLAVADDGSIHVAFLDRRWDPDNRLNDVTWAISTDGGKTWHNQRVTSVAWDGDLGRHQEGGPFIGDYIGIDAVGNDVWFAVPDTSLGGEPVVAVGHVTKGGGE